MQLEKNITASPQQLFEIAAYWESTRTCINIKVLPDQLEREGISWKYYAPPDEWMNALQAIRHVRFGAMWKKVQDPETFLEDLRQDTCRRSRGWCPPRVSPTSTRARHERLRG